MALRNLHSYIYGMPSKPPLYGFPLPHHRVTACRLHLTGGWLENGTYGTGTGVGYVVVVSKVTVGSL